MTVVKCVMNFVPSMDLRCDDDHFFSGGDAKGK